MDEAALALADFARQAGLRAGGVLTLLDAIAALDDHQVARLHELAADRSTRPGWQAAADAGWRSVIDLGGRRQRAWYLARHVAGRAALDRGLSGTLPYLLEYAAAAVCHRDQLTAAQYDALTGFWRTAIGPPV